MKYLSILFVATIAIISCTPEEEAAVDACECKSAMDGAVDSVSNEDWKADSVNAACVAAMEVEGALDSCGEAAPEVTPPVDSSNDSSNTPPVTPVDSSNDTSNG